MRTRFERERRAVPHDRSLYATAPIPLLVISALAYGALGKLVDGNLQLTDNMGRNVVQSNGNIGSYVSILLLFVAVAIATVGLFAGDRSRTSNGGTNFWLITMLGWWVICVVIYQAESPGIIGLLSPVMAFVLMVGVVSYPPNDRSLLAVNIIRDVGAAGAILISSWAPNIGSLPCRVDKCGLFGSMWTGFAYHENSAAAGFILLLPLSLLYRARWRQGVAVALVIVLTLGSGSRTSIVGVAAVVAFMVLAPRWERRGAVPLYARAFPLLAFLISGLIYLGLISVELTGRDIVYKGIRDATTGYAAFFGPGGLVVERATGGYVTGEHGQFPHVLANSGWVGVALFFFAMLSFLAQRRHDMRSVVATGLLLVAATRFVSEPGWTLSARSIEFASMVLVVSLLGRGEQSRHATGLSVREDSPNDAT